MNSPRESDGLPERLGKKVNELDIDFSNFTLAGWVTVLASLGSGVAIGWLVYSNVPQQNPMDKGPAFLIGVGGLTAAILVFFLTRKIFRITGVSITRK